MKDKYDIITVMTIAVLLTSTCELFDVHRLFREMQIQMKPNESQCVLTMTPSLPLCGKIKLTYNLIYDDD